MIDGLIWAEGTPPELVQRCQESIARNKAAVRVMDADPGSPLALAAARSAQIEGERCKALLGEWTVEERETAWPST